MTASLPFIALMRTAPTVDVLGSYFPAWMSCIVAGLAATLVMRLLFIGFGLHEHLRPKTLIYPCLTLLFTLGAWLAFYQN